MGLTLVVTQFSCLIIPESTVPNLTRESPKSLHTSLTAFRAHMRIDTRDVRIYARDFAQTSGAFTRNGSAIISGKWRRNA